MDYNTLSDYPGCKNRMWHTRQQTQCDAGLVDSLCPWCLKLGPGLWLWLCLFGVAVIIWWLSRMIRADLGTPSYMVFKTAFAFWVHVRKQNAYTSYFRVRNLDGTKRERPFMYLWYLYPQIIIQKNVCRFIFFYLISNGTKLQKQIKMTTKTWLNWITEIKWHHTAE